MAKRRLFSTTIVEDDVFLDMPSSSQNLYFHLCMNADDDGFVSPRKIMRMCSANQDDLLILISKRYILVFESGIAVIKHWLVQNSIRKDRYLATTYQKEFKQLTLNEWGVYTERQNAQTELLNVNSITTPDGSENTLELPNGNQMTTQVSLSQVKLNTTVGKKAPVDKPEKLPTTGNKYFEVNALYDDLSGLVNPTMKAWYCQSFFKIGRERVLILASQAKADGKDPQKLFSHLLKQELSPSA